MSDTIERRTSPARRAAVTVLLVAAALATVAALAYLALRGPAEPTSLQGRTRVVAESLLCPVCEDLSVADSPSPIAGEIRHDIARRLAAGQTAAQIRAYYVERYGTRILLSPPKSGATLVAWLVPGLLLGAGAVLVLVAVRRWTVAGSDTPQRADGQEADGLSASDRRLLDQALGEEREPG